MGRSRPIRATAASVGLLLFAFVCSVAAEPKAKPVNRPVAAKRKPAPRKPAKAEGTKADAAKADAAKADASKKVEEDESSAKPSEKQEAAEHGASSESQVQGARSPAGKQESGPGVVDVKEAEGVKTYQFGAIEVEGRLKSPQVIYFLRRVRAEFDAAHLGHRSFLRELSDTRRHRSLR